MQKMSSTDKQFSSNFNEVINVIRRTSKSNTKKKQLMKKSFVSKQKHCVNGFFFTAKFTTSGYMFLSSFGLQSSYLSSVHAG